jgi:SLOG family YspA-like protein
MRVIIAGTRSICDETMVRKAIETSGFLISEMVSGGSKGVDESVERIAEKDGIPFKRFLPDWNKYGKKAGPVRNREMAAYADALIAVWDGKSRGTRHMIETIRKAGKPVCTLMV